MSDDGLETVILTNATRTQDGQHGPGLVQVPPGEAGELVSRRLAVYGGRRSASATHMHPEARPAHPAAGSVTGTAGPVRGQGGLHTAVSN